MIKVKVAACSELKNTKVKNTTLAILKFKNIYLSF